MRKYEKLMYGAENGMVWKVFEMGVEEKLRRICTRLKPYWMENKLKYLC